MVKIVNIMKAASVWVAAIFMLYGNRDVESTARRTGRFQSALAVSRSPEGGAKGVKVYGGKEFHKAREFREQTPEDVVELRTQSLPTLGLQRPVVRTMYGSAPPKLHRGGQWD